MGEPASERGCDAMRGGYTDPRRRRGGGGGSKKDLAAIFLCLGFLFFVFDEMSLGTGFRFQGVSFWVRLAGWMDNEDPADTRTGITRGNTGNMQRAVYVIQQGKAGVRAGG